VKLAGSERDAERPRIEVGGVIRRDNEAAAFRSVVETSYLETVDALDDRAGDEDRKAIETRCLGRLGR